MIFVGKRWQCMHVYYCRAHTGVHPYPLQDPTNAILFTQCSVPAKTLFLLSLWHSLFSPSDEWQAGQHWGYYICGCMVVCGCKL